jgi:STE24 endopeptidase
MELTTELIIVVFSLVFLTETLADHLNLTRLKSGLPTEFHGLYDELKYQNSLRYQSEVTQFGLWVRSIHFVVFIAFLLLKGWNWADLWACQFQLGTIQTGLVFVALLSLLKMLFQLPFSLYSTFVIESKYGFNRTTPWTFFSDSIKGLVLSAVLGAPVFAGILYFFETAGPLAWLYAWIGLTVFQVGLTYLAPAFIMPLFNRFDPLPEGNLKNAIEAFAAKRKFQLSGIFTMDSSKRSTKSNAFFTGFGKLRKLVLFDTLISKQTSEELVAILAHEIGHYEKKHILQSMLISTLLSGMMLYIFSLLLNQPDLFQAFKIETPSIYAGLVLLGTLAGPALWLIGVLALWRSRTHEFEADRFARETFGKPEALISALKKLSVDHLSHLNPHPLKVILEYSHPPILERIKALRTGVILLILVSTFSLASGTVNDSTQTTSRTSIPTSTSMTPAQAQPKKLKYGPDATPLSLSHEYFRNHDSTQFWAMIPYYAPQQTGSSCSAAAATLLINGARAGKTLSSDEPLATESKVIQKSKQSGWKFSLSIMGRGVNLDHLGPYLESSLKAYDIQPISVETVHANKDSTEIRAKIHQMLIESEKNPKHFILANFIQGVYTGDSPTGHYAPIGAYDSEKKRVLILDPDREWYEPYWVSEEVFFNGMATTDPSAQGAYRGLIRVILP